MERIDIKPDNDIRYEVFCARMPSVDYLDVLIMKFYGTYGVGSAGNGDARYMTAVTAGAISYTDPFGIIFDFTELSYQWGDRMAEVLGAGEDRFSDGEMPFAVVVSDKCEEAIVSLFGAELMVSDLAMIFHSVDKALAYIDKEHRRADAKADR